MSTSLGENQEQYQKCILHLVIRMRRSPNGWIVAGACPPEQATLAKEGSLRRASHFGEAALFRRKAPGQAANEVSAAFRAPQARGTLRVSVFFARPGQKIRSTRWLGQFFVRFQLIENVICALSLFLFKLSVCRCHERLLRIDAVLLLAFF